VSFYFDGDQYDRGEVPSIVEHRWISEMLHRRPAYSSFENL
jgi:hypothetical protein